MNIYILLYGIGVLLTFTDADFRNMVIASEDDVPLERWVVIVLVINLTLLLTLAMIIWNLNKLVKYLFGEK